jgi:hypothetical protein
MDINDDIVNKISVCDYSYNINDIDKLFQYHIIKNNYAYYNYLAFVQNIVKILKSKFPESRFNKDILDLL